MMPNIEEIGYEPRRNDDDYRQEVEGLLKIGYGQFRFHKVDGSVREMNCTLKPDVAPPVNNLRQTADQVVVYDVDVEGWRTVTYDRVLSWKFLGETITPTPQVSTWQEDNS
jgi:hypothetical protein